MQSLLADRVLKFSTMKALVEKKTHKTRIWFQDVKEKMTCSPQIFFSINNFHKTNIVYCHKVNNRVWQTLDLKGTFPQQQWLGE